MKEILVVNGGKELSGEVNIGGAKNSLVAIIVASIITKSVVKLDNVIPIDDTYTLINILNKLNVITLYDDKSVLYIDARGITNIKLDNEDVMKMRASYYFMGALLSLYKEVSVIGPGGCNFGDRPIDMHLYAFECLGYGCDVDNGLYKLRKVSNKIKEINFKKKSVGATINAVLASCKRKGKVVINNCALEPEVDDLINFLNKCGCDIYRCRESVIVNGVKKLHGCEYKVMSDRIEAGTFMIIGGLLGHNLKINNVDINHLKSVINVLKDIGVDVKVYQNSVVVSKGDEYKSVDIVVEPYPGFPTDLQQPLTVLLSKCNGVSSIKETIYPARLSHIESLNEMGADIEIKEDLIIVNGGRSFIRGNVSGKDLRGGISLVVASLLSKGESRVDGVKYIKRGYSDLIYKLNNIGADIKLERVFDDE